MFEIISGNAVPKLPTSDTFFNSCSKMSPGDYAIVDFKTLEDCRRHQKIARVAIDRNGYKLVTKKTTINKNKFTLEIWCIEKPPAVDPFFGE